MYRSTTEMNSNFGKEFSNMNVDGNAVGNNDALTIISGYEVLFREKMSISFPGFDGGSTTPVINLVVSFKSPSRLEEVLDSGNIIMGLHRRIDKGILRFSATNLKEEEEAYIREETEAIMDGLTDGQKGEFSVFAKTLDIQTAAYESARRYYRGVIIGPAKQVISLYDIMQATKTYSQSDLVIRFA